MTFVYLILRVYKDNLLNPYIIVYARGMHYPSKNPTVASWVAALPSIGISKLAF